jgi:hypothetical protein
VAGFQTVVSCGWNEVYTRHGPDAPRALDALLAELPVDVDPRGENGELHTFVTAGPMFRRPIAVEPGEVVERDGFVFADLMPAWTAYRSRRPGTRPRACACW